MRIGVDIGHPAHIHYLRNAIAKWKEHGHDIFVTSRDKDLAVRLLDLYGISHVCISRPFEKGFVGLICELLVRDWKLWGLMRNFKPDILVGPSVSITHVGALISKPSVVMHDTENARAVEILSVPFASCILTPSCFTKKLGKRHVRFNGYLELSHLHPNRFTPNPETLKDAGLNAGERFFIIRFVSWKAAHDIGQSGFSLEGKRDLVRRLSELGRVIITSESKLPSDLEPYQMRVSPTKIHDLLAYSSLYVGEGATMASEAAMLGIPSIYVNTLTAGTLEELEQRFGLVRRIVDERQAIESAVKLASEPNMRREYQRKRQRLLEEKIDVTAWMVDFVERYPKSLLEYQQTKL